MFVIALFFGQDHQPFLYLRFMRSLFLSLIIFAMTASVQAAEDEAYFHNLIRDALSFGTVLNNLGSSLNKTYDFAQQNRPVSRLPLLSVKASLQSSAASVAVGCNFEHSDTLDVGENIFVGTGTNWTIEKAINAWANEARYLNYPENAQTVSCQKEGGGACTTSKEQIGHYTQMVWQETTHVGCGLQICNQITDDNGVFYSVESTIVFCHYSAQGNYVNGAGKILAPYIGMGEQPAVTNPPTTPTGRLNLVPILLLLLTD
ncbi:MAG: CAP domain-containing protein [Arenicellales bacterium]